MSDSEINPGNTSQVVQSYGIESLVGVSSLITDIREFHFRQVKDSRPLYKQIQQHPAADESGTGTGIFTDGTFNKLYGKQAALIKKSLLRSGYCRPSGTDHCTLTWRFRSLLVDDFDIGLGAKSNNSVFRSLEALLWEPLPGGRGIDNFIKALNSPAAGSSDAAISNLEYWFRQGINIVAFRFSSPPSPELISLIDHKLQLIQQEKLQNYFHIISSFNADNMMWKQEKNKNRRFFEIIEHLLVYTWRPFDMERCEVSIDAAGDEGLIASGSLRVDFAENGTPTARFDRLEKRFPQVNPGGYEFTVNDVSLRASEFKNDSSYLSLHMVSRSTGNVDPRRNMLTHRFVKLFVESVGKLIDVIIPVIRREEAVQDLKWRYFLDSLRLRALDYGENLHLIVSDSLEVLRKFFGISEVMIFSEDKDLTHMLDLFSRSNLGEKNYKLLNNPITPADILKRQLLLFPIREIPGGRVLLYFDLPRIGKLPLNPESPDQYLMGTDLWNIVNGEAVIHGVTELKDYLFFMVTECLTANPKAVMANLSRRLPVRGDVVNVDHLMKLSRSILERLGRFFDLFQAFSGNLESGLAYMRGRRDNLTGLYNRQHFKTLLNESFSNPGIPLGLIFLDMDNFKIYNDAVSHDFGDKLLISLANRMIEATENIGPEAVSGRFGGDEFCFFIAGMGKDDFEEKSIEVFRSITEKPLVVSFYFDDRNEGEGMEINLISFLHRLMRPDVGSRQASRSEYIEKVHKGPKAHVVDIWKHYATQEGKALNGLKIRGEQIIREISVIVEDKILYNKIFTEIDPEFSRIIHLFIALQLKGYTTNRIRDSLIQEFGGLSVDRRITLKVSAGAAHNSENRLRSMDSLFKAADSRSYLAKSNGRNCLFGVDGAQLA